MNGFRYKSGPALAVKDSAFQFETKSLTDEGTFEGYGSIFGNVDSYNEIVEPGAFAESLVANQRGSKSIKLLWQHNPGEPIGVWEDLAEDKKGLWGRARLLIGDVARAKEAHALMKAGALDGLSIGYRTIEAKPKDGRPGVLSLTKLDLKEISVVTFAANDRARVEDVKSMVARGEMPTLRQFEEFMREAGFSKSDAVTIAKHGFVYLVNRGEPGTVGANTDPEALKAFNDALASIREIRIGRDTK